MAGQDHLLGDRLASAGVRKSFVISERTDYSVGPLPLLIIWAGTQRQLSIEFFQCIVKRVRLINSQIH